MEGEVLQGGIGLPLPLLVAVVASVLGGFFALLKWFAARLLADIDARLARMDVLDSELHTVDEDLKHLVAEMPLHYQRREDAIREAAQLDERYERLVKGFIDAMQRDLQDTRARVSEIEKAREQERSLFQMRDDAIREYTAMNAKLDRIYEIMLEVKNGR